MFYPLLILFIISLAVVEAFFCSHALRVTSFGDITADRVHSIKKTTSVFYGNSDDVSEMEMMQKVLEKKDAEIKKKDAEILDFKFAQVITKIDTSAEVLKKEINALNSKIDTLDTKVNTSAEALNSKIDTLNTKIDTSAEALNSKIDTKFAMINVGLVATFCLTLSDKFPSLIAAFLKK